MYAMTNDKTAPVGFLEVKELLSSIHPLPINQVKLFLAIKIKTNPVFIKKNNELPIEKAITIAEKNINYLIKKKYLFENNGILGLVKSEFVSRPEIIYPFYYALFHLDEHSIVGIDERHKKAIDMFFISNHIWYDILFLDKKNGDKKLYMYELFGKQTAHSLPVLITIDEELTEYKETLMPTVTFLHVKMTPNENSLFPTMKENKYKGI